MTRSRSHFVEALVAFLIGSGAVAVLASAHPLSEKYPLGTLASSPHYYAFRTDFPDTTWRARVHNGAQDWNALGQGMQFHHWPAGDDPAGVPCPSLPWLTIIRKGYFDGPGGYWGWTAPCIVNGQIHGARVIFDDSGTTWYKGTGTPPAGQMDAWAAATHEFGHVSGGWYRIGNDDRHFTGGDLCNTAPRHTMCAFMGEGENFMRGPVEHDVHTFGAAY